MLLATGERTIDLAEGIVGFVSTFTPGAIAFLERKVRSVPLIWISTIRPGPDVDLFSCVSFHPLHSWVLASLLAPVTIVNECLLGWERHPE